MNEPGAIQRFLAAPTFAVLGASTDRGKYGNKVLRCYQQNRRPAVPIHPSEAEIEGAKAFRSIAEVPLAIESASIITPPKVTERLIAQLAANGVKRVWMQPGAESPAAIAEAERLGIEVIAGGPCVLVVLGFRE